MQNDRAIKLHISCLGRVNQMGPKAASCKRCLTRARVQEQGHFHEQSVPFSTCILCSAKGKETFKISYSKCSCRICILYLVKIRSFFKSDVQMLSAVPSGGDAPRDLQTETSFLFLNPLRGQ